MYFIFTNNKVMSENMSKKASVIPNALASIGLATALTIDSASADKINDNKDNLTAKKFEKVLCKTKLACEKLSISIQNQIDKLEEKGLENLTEKEFNRYDELSNKLIALENNKQEIKNKKQAEENLKQSAYKELSNKLDTIKGSL